ncbi:hypothetical protein M407DRAFT_33775 [Tulasnella calospora MUT 4182]|uniref:DUF4219 domain-containing protein n=1 Tax=Tulasnella calospora MUT 4182 TaxID=1051891 RepID=A0A0C3Q2E7_9AGAM|nr:hypothetical protein M407DRAFT_33775 [Tulasnella calospora MUT 4182]
MSAPIVTLTEGNWAEWSEYIHTRLSVLAAWECVDPGWSVPITTTPKDAAERKELREWSKCQAIALGGIPESISPANKRLVKGKNAKDAYELLKTTYNKPDDAR